MCFFNTENCIFWPAIYCYVIRNSKQMGIMFYIKVRLKNWMLLQFPLAAKSRHPGWLKQKKSFNKTQHHPIYKNNLRSQDMAEFQLMLRLPSRPIGKCFAFVFVLIVFNCFEFSAHFSAQIPLLYSECGDPDNSSLMTVTQIAEGS